MNRCILIVDDDEDTLRLLQMLARTVGIDVCTARSGIEALLLLQTGSYCTLITDFIMPGMDGVALAQQARKQQPELNIVLMTGTIIPDLEELVVSHGISRVLYKPFSSEVFLELLNRNTVIASTLKMPDSQP